MGQQILTQSIAEIFIVSNSALALPPSTVNVGGQQFTTASNLPLNTATVGLGGLDTGTIAASSQYYIYAVLSGLTPGLVASLANPSVGPAGFPLFKQVGGFTTDGSAFLAQAWSKVRSAYLISTSGNYTVPYGLKYFKMRVVGGGGAGGGSLAGGGGGAGGYFEGKFKGIPGGTVIPITIGSGGAPNSGAGTGTIVGGPINLTATGGGGGVGGGSGAHPGGSGGGVTGTLPADVIAVQGQNGGWGFSAGGIAVEGSGGSSAMFGGGGAADAFTSGYQGNAVSYGSGGGGSYATAGAGDPGVVVIEEYYS